MAQGVAWSARRLGIPCTVVVPDHAPRAKLEAIERLGAPRRHGPVRALVAACSSSTGYPGVEGLFIHPVARPGRDRGQRHDRSRDPRGPARRRHDRSCRTAAAGSPAGSRRRSARAANAAKGSAAGARTWPARSRPRRRWRRRSRPAHPVDDRVPPSFVDGIGGKSLLPEMWPLGASSSPARSWSSLDGDRGGDPHCWSPARAWSPKAPARSPVAAALSGRAGGGKIVCVVSGGNIDREKLASILAEG